ncbi:MAG: hypothetical protein DHS20C16_01020 [Phycisphaerae bacterium]|nr:MAG: hypothetical protein DHS20C16_01020 [Phycisphaerae bacterium]
MRIPIRLLSIIVLVGIVGVCPGCGLREIRTKTKFGVEARHTNDDKSHVERYLVQEALQFKWDHGIDTSLIYRRRDVSNSESGDSDDGVWFEIGLPIWKAPKKPDKVKARMAALERRVAELEQSLGSTKQSDPPVQPIPETPQ